MLARACLVLLFCVACVRPREAVPDGGPPPTGSACVTWRIACAGRDPCACEDVGARVVEVRVRDDDGDVVYDEPFECLQSLAVTGALRRDRYELELSLQRPDGVELGAARTRGAIDAAIIDLGPVTFEIGG
jgi:hypothetical protein